MNNYYTIWPQTLGFPFIAVLLRVRTLVLLCGMVVFSFTQTAEAQSYVFSKFEVSGNQRIESNTVLSYAGLERDATISAGALNTAYRNILASGLFERVDMEPVGSTLKILVVELPTLNQIVFEGNKRLKTEALLKAIQSQPRRVFNAEMAEQDAARVVDAYVQKGRLAARVTPKAIRRSARAWSASSCPSDPRGRAASPPATLAGVAALSCPLACMGGAEPGACPPARPVVHLKRPSWNG